MRLNIFTIWACRGIGLTRLALNQKIERSNRSVPASPVNAAFDKLHKPYVLQCKGILFV